MYYVLTNPDNSVESILSDRFTKPQDLPPAAIAITDAEFEAMNDHPLGFGMFDCVDGVVVENATRVLTQKRDAVKQKVKRHANGNILAIAPEWKQRNMLARGLELTDKRVGGQPVNAAEQTEIDGMKAIWTQVEQWRNASDTIEAEVDVDMDPDNFDIENHPAWPVV